MLVFCTCSTRPNSGTAKTSVGTPIYMAPEVIYGSNRYDAKVKTRAGAAGARSMISCHKPANPFAGCVSGSDTLHCGSELHGGQLHLHNQLADLSKRPTLMRLTHSAL